MKNNPDFKHDPELIKDPFPRRTFWQSEPWNAYLAEQEIDFITIDPLLIILPLSLTPYIDHPIYIKPHI